MLAGLGRGGVCRCSVFEGGVEGNEGEGRDGEEEERIGSLVLRRHPLRLQCHCSSSGDRDAFPGAQTAQNARARAQRVLVLVLLLLLAAATAQLARWTSATRTEQTSSSSAPATKTTPQTSSHSAARTPSRSSSS